MRVLIYGATGYTGRLIARQAAADGMPATLAGRNARAVASLAEELGLPWRAFELHDVTALRHAVADVSAVLHCAGPFSHTWRPLVDACISVGTHYIDITGEIDVFEGAAALDARARTAGVLLLPGAGFDVVPSDCLAVHVAGRMPDATRLLLGIRGSGPLSRGTAATAIENQDRGGMIRRAGQLVRVPAAWRTRTIDFGDGRSRTAVTIPWGDVATAYYSTGIDDIEVYAAVPPRLVRTIRLTGHLRWLLRRRAVKRLERALLRLRAAGPDEHELAHGESRIWARVENAAGDAVEAVLRGPNGYRITVDASLEIVRRVLDGNAPAGYHTPATAYGADLVLALPGIVVAS